MMSVYDYFLKLCWVFMVFHGSRSVFMVFTVSGGFYDFHGSRLAFMVPGGFSWFSMVPG